MNTSRSINTSKLLPNSDVFCNRHIGSSVAQQKAMLEHLNVETLDELIDKVVPRAIRRKNKSIWIRIILKLMH